MGLLDEAAHDTKPPGSPSRLSKLLAALDGDERAEVVTLIWDRPDISSRAAAAALNRHYPDDGPFTGQQVRNHRMGERL